MSALTDRIVHLLRQGKNVHEIGDIVGLSAADVAARVVDPSLADPTSGVGLVGGGGGGGSLPQALYRQATLLHTEVYNPWTPSDAVYDDIGITLDPTSASFGDNTLLVPQGRYLVVGGVETFTQPALADGMLVANLAMSCSGFTVDTYGSRTFFSSVVFDHGSPWSGMQVVGFLNADTDMVALDPSYAGLFGGVKIFSQQVRKVSDASAPSTGVDLQGWHLHLTKVA